jgi:uncharacterized membrane protein
MPGILWHCANHLSGFTGQGHTDRMKRIQTIDFVRGLVMVIMALDHVRDLMHIDSLTQNPTNLLTTTPLLFFTRWVTHLCAPIFVFLAGTSAWLSLKNRDHTAGAARHLFKRGFWLILVEFSVVNFGLFFDTGFHILIFEVIGSTGFGFIILSLLLKLPAGKIGIMGLAIICCHNLVPLIPVAETSLFKVFVTPLFSPATFPIGAGKVFIVAYPPVPWLGIMLTGFASGSFFELADQKRKLLFLKLGAGALLCFCAIRFINIYGDPAAWYSQKNAVLTVLSFMNVTKYPPSLAFCLATLGIMFLILTASGDLKGKIVNIVMVYGKVPLFYFIVHFYLIHLATITMLFFQGFSWTQLEFASGTFGRPKDTVTGLNLGAVYLVWIAAVAALYRPCLWFAQYKAGHKYWWLRYL